MPTLIVFDAAEPGSGGGETGRNAQIRVAEELQDVVAKLGAANGGFVDFSLDRDPSETIWVNSDQIQMVRAK